MKKKKNSQLFRDFKKKIKDIIKIKCNIFNNLTMKWSSFNFRDKNNISFYFLFWEMVRG